MNFDQIQEKLQEIQQAPISQDQLIKIEQSAKNTKTIKFDLIVRYFQKMASLRGVKKGNYSKQFIKVLFKFNRSPQFTYSIFRVLLPSDDRQRGNYGLKQKGLAKVISDCLGLSKPDYQRLYHYKNPNYHKRGFGIGDFSLCVYDVVRNFCKEKSQLTVAQLNILLDQLALSNQNYTSVFTKLFQKSNPEQIKWIIRIVLKDLKLSIKIESVLNAYHKDASDFFNLTNSLFEVSKKFVDPNISLNDEITIFNPIRPMLAGKKKINFFKYQSRMYYVQTKYDGQRIQAHWNGNQIRLFSRNAINYTHVYKQITQLLQKNIEANACILDGQIIVLQKESLSMVPFGMNKVVALSNDESDMQLCYMVFDILWIRVQNQQMNMMKYSLRQRKSILRKVFKPIKGKLQIVEHKQISDYDQIIQQFGSSIQRNQQGIMLKDPESLYLPKERGSCWIKLKGDYIDGLTDTLDLIIIGGYFGDKSYRQGDSNHWTDQVTTFLLGVIQRFDQRSRQIAYAFPFAKVGTGYSGEQLSALRQKLKKNMILNQGKTKPQFLNTCNWKYSIQDKPDCWINHLKNSIILQIKAAQIIRSQSYPTNTTLRFPRVVKIRYDKDWNEGMTLAQLDNMMNSQKYTKNMKKKDDDSNSQPQKNVPETDQPSTKRVKSNKLKAFKNKNILLDDFSQVQLGVDQKLRSNLFYDLQFSVLPLIYNNIHRHDVEKQIILNGGSVTQNPLSTTKYIVADHIDFRLKIYEQQASKNLIFIKPKYIFNCVSSQALLPLTPLYLTCLPKTQKQYYFQHFDRFSDSYTMFLSRSQLDQILAQMPNTQYPINQDLMKVIQVKHRRNGYTSICLGVRKLDKIKLRIHKNKFVQTFDQLPNSVVVGPQINFQQDKNLSEYLKKYPKTIVQTTKELTAAYIL